MSDTTVEMERDGNGRFKAKKEQEPTKNNQTMSTITAWLMLINWTAQLKDAVLAAALGNFWIAYNVVGWWVLACSVGAAYFMWRITPADHWWHWSTPVAPQWGYVVVMLGYAIIGFTKVWWQKWVPAPQDHWVKKIIRGFVAYILYVILLGELPTWLG